MAAMAQAQSFGGGQPFVIVLERAVGLRNADGPFGKSDPYVLLTIPDPGSRSHTPKMTARTSTIQGNLNPVWNEAILAVPGPDGRIDLSVFDSDAGTIVDGTDDLLGKASFDCLSVTPGAWATKSLTLGGHPKATGTIDIKIRWYSTPVVTIHRCQGLRNADGMFGTSDPYVKVTGLSSSRSSGKNGGKVWGRTRTVENQLSPTFEETFTCDCYDLMPRGGKMSPLVVQAWDSDDLKNGTTSKDDLLGEVQLEWLQVWPGQDSDYNFPLTGRKAKGSLSMSISLAPLNQGQGGGGAGGRAGADLASVGKTLFNVALEGEDEYPPAPAAAEEEYPGTPPTAISKGACKAVLAKGYGFKIADCCDTVPDHFTCGLAWDVTNGVNIDLDASAIMLGSNLSLKDIVFFGKLQSSDGSIKHGGDEREGDEVGDDEKIFIDLGRVHSSVTYIGICVNSYSGQELNDVKDCKVRMYDTNTLAEAASFDLSSDQSLDCCALLMAVLYRVGDEWWMYAIGEGAHGTMAKDNVDEFQDFIRQHQLVEQALAKDQRGGPAKKVKLKVPPKRGGGSGPNKIAFKSGNEHFSNSACIQGATLTDPHWPLPTLTDPH